MICKFHTYLLVAWAFLLVHPAKSQSNGMISQYMFNRLLINPAYAGNNEALTLNFLNKDQWTSVKGAPSTRILSAHSPTSDQVGLGLTLLSDRMGKLNQKGIYGAYSYRIKSPNHTLSFGLQAGLSSFKYSNLFIRDEFDPVFDVEDARLIQPNFGTGIYYESNSWYMGFSIPQLVRINNKDHMSWSSQNRRYFFQGGCSFLLSNSLILNPSTLIFFEQNSKPVINLNANVLIENLVWVGAIYRNLDNLGFLGKIQLNRQLQLGYGYDANMGGLAELSAGSHEIMIQYSFNYVEKNIISPRFF
jgi:type IX secretion system PorP/SprF family membrane protein